MGALSGVLYWIKEDIKILQQVQNEAFRFIFIIKGPISFSQLRHNSNILSLEEHGKEKQRPLFFKSYAHSVDLNFIVPLEPKAEKMKNFIQTRQGAFSRPFIRSKQYFYSGHEPLVILEMVFSILSFRAL